MVTNLWLYSIIMFIYALGLLFYLADFLFRKASAKRTGTGLLALVWVLQAIFFLARMFQEKYVPVITMFEALFFLSWAIVTAALVLFLLLRQELAVFFLGAFGFVVLLAALFIDPATAASVSHIDVTSALMLVHMSLGLISYAAFTVSAIFSGMYLFLHWKLKEKRWSAGLRRLPSLDSTESYAFRTVLTGSAFLLISLSLGVVRIWMMDDIRMLLDPKVLTTIILFGAYCVYVLLKLGLLVSGKRLALWNLAAYAIMLINFIISNYVSDFHRWTWFT